MDFPFQPYPKITDGSDWLKLPAAKKHSWYVTEKVHGSCFCLASRGDAVVRAGKRSGWVDAEYFDVESLRLRLAPKIQALHGLLDQPNHTAKPLFVYGELFGAGVQSEIFYQEEMDFVVFDVRFDGEFVDYERVLKLCKEVDLPCIQPLFVGKLNQCMDFKTQFPTTFSAAAKKDDAEGVVIKCSKEIEVQNSSGKRTRPVCKHKSPKFSETVSSCKAVKGKEREALLGYMTRNRLVNVTSKMGKIKNRKDASLRNTLIEKLVADGLEEAQNDPLLRTYLKTKDKAAFVAMLKPDATKVVEAWQVEKK